VAPLKAPLATALAGYHFIVIRQMVLLYIYVRHGAVGAVSYLPLWGCGLQ